MRKFKGTKEELEETKGEKFKISGIRQNYWPDIRPNQYLMQPY